MTEVKETVVNFGTIIIKMVIISVVCDIFLNDFITNKCYQLKIYPNDYSSHFSMFFYSLIGNMMFIKFLILIIYTSSIFKDVIYVCKNKKSGSALSNSVFVKSVLYSTGLIFFQIIIALILKMIIYYNFKNRESHYTDYIFTYNFIHIILNIFVSILFIYMFYELEMTDNLICEDTSLTIGIFLMIIFIIYLLMSIKYLQYILLKIPPLSRFVYIINYLFIWDKNINNTIDLKDTTIG